MSKKESILNIGAGPGRIKPIIWNELKQGLLINLDITYENVTSIEGIANCHRNFDRKDFGSGGALNGEAPKQIYYSNLGWEKFINLYQELFDRVVIYRFLEHVPMRDVLYFIYMLSTIVKVGGYVEGIVPNYRELAARLMLEKPGSKEYESDNILLTTEIVNEPNDPHASIWTEDRLLYYFRMEKRFEIDRLCVNYEFDGRDIYIWFQCKRIK